MPELPEVERGRRLAASVAEGKRIEALWCASDAIVFDGVGPARFHRALKGARVEAVRRRGKVIFFQLDRRPWPLFHFGMTGAFRTREACPLRLRSHGKEIDASWPPRFAKIRLSVEGGGALVMTNARRLGRILLREDPLREPPIGRMGFDPLLDLPSPHAFERMLEGRHRTLKGLLLDQTFAAGVGNWIADEVLYQARLDPRRRASDLSSREARRLGRTLGRVVQAAVKVNAEKDRFPRTWLFHHRWHKKQGARTARGEAIQFIEVAGRTTAWVPSVQGGEADQGIA